MLKQMQNSVGVPILSNVRQYESKPSKLRQMDVTLH